MKTLLFCICVLLGLSTLNAQENYTINGETFQLKTEVNGKIDLLWNIIDNEYRYFIRTSDNNITELVNTRDGDDNYQEQYKTTLENATSGISAGSTRSLSVKSASAPSMYRIVLRKRR